MTKIDIGGVDGDCAFFVNLINKGGVNEAQ